MLGLALMQVWGCAQQAVSSGAAEASSSSKKEINIFCAAGVKPAIDESAKIFGQKYGIKLNINYGGTGEVLSNMIVSQTGDLYIAAEQRYMQTAKKKGVINGSMPISSVAYMIPVIGVVKGNPLNIQSLQDLTRPGVRVAVTRTETTALGLIVPEILQRAHVLDAVQPNIVTTAPQVNAIVTMMIMRQVDAGIIWHHFGTTNSSDIEIIWIPAEFIPDVGEVQVAISSYSEEPQSAQKYIEFLSSAEGKAIFVKYGYLVDSSEADKYRNASAETYK